MALVKVTDELMRWGVRICPKCGGHLLVRRTWCKKGSYGFKNSMRARLLICHKCGFKQNTVEIDSNDMSRLWSKFRRQTAALDRIIKRTQRKEGTYWGKVKRDEDAIDYIRHTAEWGEEKNDEVSSLQE